MNAKTTLKARLARIFTATTISLKITLKLPPFISIEIGFASAPPKAANDNELTEGFNRQSMAGAKRNLARRSQRTSSR